MDAAELLTKGWPYIVAAAPGAWAVWRSFSNSRRGARRERTDLVRIAQDAAASVIGDLREEIDRLQRQVNELEAELNTARKEHADTIAAKDAELALLRGRLRQALANVEAYERLLTAHDIPHPQPAQAFYLVDAGDYPTDVHPL